MDVLQPWPWYVAGPLIGLTVPLLLILGNKSFGISASLRHICASCFPAGISFFKYDWKKEQWNLFFVFGIMIGGFLATYFLSVPGRVEVSSDTVEQLKAQGIKNFNGLLPADIFNWQQLLTLRGFVFIIIGGFLVGFGTRYAGGCTSGHAIMGISSLQWPSLIATCCFMAGGFATSWLLLPLLLKL
ncbi:YeeE/YedE family protein [Pedobacter rhodius]|uniref:YeeE/YedE thiosulfate transporter family protein n=1 Tax=Pedobacter rhodius TaxID=3004098 RepID=A0ABT4KWP8_9SPHI|nr:YeeE/YedE thiosulfate transporter family protein [Pedobacter sp. SJ11]MCZ4223353.1 YeeE/YedE thiosulfate transporter family protein [Pedobacter sp. SJ11]